MNRKKAVISGGSGLIGRQLTQMLIDDGYTVTVLTRKRSASLPRGVEQSIWNPDQEVIDPAILENAGVVINLAGAGVADARWTAARKEEIYQSRIRATRTLVQAMHSCSQKPECLISASAIGFYGDAGNQLLNENAAPDSGFLARVCRDWEHEALRASAEDGIRTCVFRIGIVLSRNGGALKEMTKTIPLGIAGYFNKTPLWTSWIHEKDLCRMMMFAAAQPAVQGIFNAVAPHPVTNKTLMEALKNQIQPKALLMPVPALGLKMALGEMAAMLLSSQRCSADKITSAGFEFLYEKLPAALQDLYGK